MTNAYGRKPWSGRPIESTRIINMHGRKPMPIKYLKTPWASKHGEVKIIKPARPKEDK